MSLRTVEPLAAAARTAAAGLSSEEARVRLARDGPNELPPAPRAGVVRRLMHHLAEPMTLLLVAAAVVSGVWLREALDAAAILVIVALNAVIAVVQEGRAERALDALRRLESTTARVWRDGRIIVLDTSSLVRGDRVIVEAGDRVPADLTLLTSASLQLDEAILTGESLPVEKALTDDDDTGDASVWSGTLVTCGRAEGAVVATGDRTRLGRIARHLRDTGTETPLQHELGVLTGRLGIVAVLLSAGVFALMATTGTGVGRTDDAFLTAVALAVAAVPEGLAAVTTVALALGVRRMARRGAIVRRLPAVEALGAIDVLAIDKTGTVTENRIRVAGYATLQATAATATELPTALASRVAQVAVLCNDASLDPPLGDPLDIALLEAISPNDVWALNESHRRVAASPFDAGRRRMSVATVDMSGNVRLHVKGAPEEVLRRCDRWLAADGEHPVDAAALEAMEALVSGLASSGSRVIALAQRELHSAPADLTDVEDALTLVALVSLRDTVRSAAQRSVEQVRRAGVTLVMVTGDHEGTACAVAAEIGLAEGGTDRRLGSDLDAWTDGDPARVPVFARVDPEQKLALVDLLHEHGHRVAMTGDGVNDAPALRRADIGVALGRSGSEVAREAADLVITDDDLATIVAAVHEGRTIYDRIRKVVDYLVAGNLSEVAVVLGAMAIFPEFGIPLLPLQLLWINLLTDGLPAIALGVDPGDAGLMQRGPRPRTQHLLDGRRVARLALRAAVIASAALGAGLLASSTQRDSATVRTIVFTTLVLAHLMYAYVARRPEHRGSRADRPALVASNPGLAAAVFGGIGLHVGIVAWGPARRVFATTALSAGEWLVAVGAALAAIVTLATIVTVQHRRPARVVRHRVMRAHPAQGAGS